MISLPQSPLVQNFGLGSWNPQVAQNLYQFLLINGQEIIECEEFEIPSQSDLAGELNLGKVMGSETIEFRHGIAKLPMHILAAGTSGSGKTNFAKILIQQCLNSGIHSIKINDPKSEYQELALQHPEFLLLKWNDLRFNPLIPPPNVPQNEWYQTIVGHLAQCFNFWEGAQSLLLKMLHIISKYKQPTIFDILKELENSRPRFKQKDYLVMSTVASRLEILLNVCSDIVLSKNSILPILINQHYILQTSGLMSEIESWLLEFILIWELMYRIFNNHHRKLTLFVFDECQHRLFSREKERNVKKISSSIISMLVDEVRALNMGICSLSQEPSTLINAVLNNSWLKLCFHLGSGLEVRTMQQALGLNKEQTEILYKLETGEAIVRMAGEFLESFPVLINEYQEISQFDYNGFYKHQKQMKARLYDIAGITGKSGAGIKKGDQFKTSSGNDHPSTGGRSDHFKPSQENDKKRTETSSNHQRNSKQGDYPWTNRKAHTREMSEKTDSGEIDKKSDSRKENKNNDTSQSKQESDHRGGVGNTHEKDDSLKNISEEIEEDDREYNREDYDILS